MEAWLEVEEVVPTTDDTSSSATWRKVAVVGASACVGSASPTTTGAHRGGCATVGALRGGGLSDHGWCARVVTANGSA